MDPLPFFLARLSTDPASLLQHLTTESQNEASQGFDTKSALEIARIINHEDSKIAAAVKKALPKEAPQPGKFRVAAESGAEAAPAQGA